MTQVDLVNSEMITVCFSDGTVGLYTAATLLTCSVKRVRSDECFAEDHLAHLGSSMPEEKLTLAIADNLRKLFDGA